MKKPKGRVIELLRSKGITRRWMINSVGIMTALLAVIWIAFVFAVHTYYYNMVGSYMNTEAKLYASQFAHSLDPKEPDFFSTAKDFVDGFGEKASMELLVMDGKGNVLLTSSGFLPDHKTSMPDLTTANQSSQGLGEWMGVDKVSGEKVIAVTSMLKDTQGKTLGTARYITSLTPIDRQIGIFSLVSGAICLAIIVFVFFSGMYFIRSIVVPVREVTSVAERIAAGDYHVRIGKTDNDEIGKLCDTINNLAGELGTTEHIKNDFISSVSHELRTPLTAIKGWAETIMASKPEDTETMHKGMQVILDETSRLSSMVEDLLDFSRMQNGRFRMVIDKIDILAELEEAVLMFTDRARRESLTLVFNEPDELPHLMGDRNRLRQVFVNILDNAFKYSAAGGEVKIETVNCGDHIKIIITDTGCGIPAQQLSRVKRKFFKGNMTKRGSGIGLAVADEIICLHGGTLELASEEGKGTEVTITLPTAEKKVPAI